MEIPKEFEKDLEKIINIHGLDTIFNKPDFVLAYMVREILFQINYADWKADQLKNGEDDCELQTKQD